MAPTLAVLGLSYYDVASVVYVCEYCMAMVLLFKNLNQIQ